MRTTITLSFLVLMFTLSVGYLFSENPENAQPIGILSDSCLANNPDESVWQFENEMIRQTVEVRLLTNTNLTFRYQAYDKAKNMP